MEFDKIEQLVAKMRELGIREYKDGDFHLILGDPPAQELDDKTQEEQQRIRDEREKQFLEHKMRILKRASWGIGPPPDKIR